MFVFATQVCSSRMSHNDKGFSGEGGGSSTPHPYIIEESPPVWTILGGTPLCVDIILQFSWHPLCHHAREVPLSRRGVMRIAAT